jgi:1-acyl-sn-glycerol-3-phosphate acyltransferase
MMDKYSGAYDGDECAFNEFFVSESPGIFRIQNHVSWVDWLRRILVVVFSAILIAACLMAQELFWRWFGIGFVLLCFIMLSQEFDLVINTSCHSITRHRSLLGFFPIWIHRCQASDQDKVEIFTSFFYYSDSRNRSYLHQIMLIRRRTRFKILDMILPTKDDDRSQQFARIVAHMLGIESAGFQKVRQFYWW